MIQLYITKTSKEYGAKKMFTIFDCQTESFKSITEAKAWLKIRYGKSKRSKMFRNTGTDKPMHIGYIFGFRNADFSRTPVYKWIQQDWVEFREVKIINSTETK